MLKRLKFYFSPEVRMAKDLRMIAEIAEKKGFVDIYTQLMVMSRNLEEKAYQKLYRR